MTYNFPKLMSAMKPQIQKTHKAPSKTNKQTNKNFTQVYSFETIGK